jgi:hypothetical protein
MKSSWFIPLVLILGTAYCLAQLKQNAPASPPGASQPTTQAAGAQGEGMAALQKAAADNKHLFIVFSEKDNEETRTLRKTVDAAAGKLADKVQVVAVNRNAAAEKPVVEKFGVQMAPMPLVLAVAPNGAITGGFLSAGLTQQRLEEAIATPAAQKALKSVQDRRFVFLSIQGKATKNNDAATKGVSDFKADPKYAQLTDVYTLDPSAPEEAAFLKQLQVDHKTQDAVTVLMAPPGMVVAKIAGATTKEAFLTALQKASSGGCGPGGCGPGGCK